MKKKLIGILVVTLMIGTVIIPVTGTIENWRIENINKESKPLFQPPEQWNKTFGGTNDDIGYSVQQIGGGEYIIIGWTNSYGSGNYDCWLIKVDSNGNKLWDKTFGGTLPDEGWSVCQTIGGGYIITGKTSSYGAGGSDVWLIKTDGNGNQQWSKTFGGTSDDWGRSVVEISSGYVIAGSTSSYGAGGSDVWLIKTDGNGNQQWSKTFGGTSDDWGWSVQEISGGFIIVGTTSSYGAGDSDVWLIKTDSNGNKLWDKTFGGGSYEEGASVQQIGGGEYIIIGWTNSYGSGNYDCWLIKVDSNGNKLWDKTFGGVADDRGWSVQEISGGYIIAGLTSSYGSGNYDCWLIKADSNGNEQWSEAYGGIGNDIGYSMQQTSDGGYVIAGGTDSYGAGGSDVWLIKIASGVNNPPNTPINPNPVNHAIDIDVDADLSWTGGDPDPGDTVIYDTYLGTSSSPPKIVTGQSGTTYDPGTMSASTTYYWQIVAWDNHGASTSGPVWDFTTAGGINNPPNKPQKPSGKTNGKAGTSYPYSTNATDPDGDKLKYGWDWNGDGTVDQWDDNSGSHYTSGVTISTSHSWPSQGTYTVKVIAEDINGAQSIWSDPLSVSMPKSKAIQTPFLTFLENHPHLFPLLQQLLRLEV